MKILSPAIQHNPTTTKPQHVLTSDEMVGPPDGTEQRYLWGAELRKWNAAFANRASAGADVFFIGDSITEGFYATDRSRRFIELLRNSLQRAYKPGGQGFIPSRFTVAGFTEYWTRVGGAASSTFGLGFRAWNMTAGTDSMQITVECDRVQLVYTRGPGVGGINISIDGGAAVIVNTYNASAASGVLWDSGALTPGQHTLRVTTNNAQAPNNVHNAIIDGIMVYNGDYSSGVRVWEGGSAGLQTTHFSVAPNYWAHIFANVDPDLLIIGLGMNDYGNAVPVATFKTRLKNIIAQAKVYTPGVDPSIMLFIQYARGDAGFTDAGWQPYRAAMYEVAAEDGCAVFDAYDSLGVLGSGAADTLGLSRGSGGAADGVHLSDSGNQMVADRFVTLLMNDVDYQVPAPKEGLVATGARSAPVGMRWEPAFMRKRFMQVCKQHGSVGIITDGFKAAPTLTATTSQADANDGPWIQHATTAVINNPSGVISADFAQFQSRWEPEFVAPVKTDGNTTNMRVWVGMFSASPDLTATPAHSIGFRYDTSVDGNQFWRAYSSNGASQTVTTTSVVYATNTAYLMAITVDQTAIYFWIDGVIVATHVIGRDNTPVNSTNLGYGIRVTTLVAGARAVSWSRIQVRHL